MIAPTIAVALALSLVGRAVVASPLDYSRVPEDRLRLSVGITIGLAIVIGGLGLIGWFRYRRSYRKEPGSIPPWTALLLVGSLVTLAAAAAFAAAID